MSNAGKDHPKKAYSKPALRVHGDIRRITEASGNAGQSDGGSKTHKRTG
jgi:hypothetical protein